MCVGTGESRKKQKKKKETIPEDAPRKLDKECSLATTEKVVAKPKELPPPAKLLSLTVANATDLGRGDDHHWTPASAVDKVLVTAVTEPDDESAWSQLDWGPLKKVASNVVEIDLTTGKDVVVKATLDCTKSVTIEIYELISVTCPLPKKVSDQKWKSYVSEDVTRLKAVTKPDEQRAWDHLTWNIGAPTAAKNECDAPLKPVKDHTVTVTLGKKSLDAILHICQWPKLEIYEVTFKCHEVLNDGVADIEKPFDKMWKQGRNPPAVNQKAAVSQSPVCFTKGKKIKLSARFKVVDLATDDETVEVKVDLGFGKMKANVPVKAGKNRAIFPETESTAALPGKVDYDDDWTIKWESSLEDGTSFQSAGESKHLLYVLFGDPKKPIYFTLLHISCEGAKGKTTEGDFVAKSFEPFTLRTGDNNGFERKGDGKKLSYYKTGWKTAGSPDAQTTKGILGTAEATGRCGGWSTMLIHMWAMHGVVGKQRWFIRASDPSLHNDELRFLVKNCEFTGAGTLNAGGYTHKHTEMVKKDGAAGQGKLNPQYDFGDHVVVKHGGKLWDPSYGIGPCDTDRIYLDLALDGLGSYNPWGQHKWVMADTTTHQHWPGACVPYSKGFNKYTIDTGGTLKEIADEFGLPPDELLELDPVLEALRLTHDKVVPGDAIKIPLRDGSTLTKVVRPAVTMDAIAAMHPPLTKQQIFDHAKNSALKILRTTVDKVKVGDEVIVNYEMDSTGFWVVGHDI